MDSFDTPEMRAIIERERKAAIDRMAEWICKPMQLFETLRRTDLEFDGGTLWQDNIIYHSNTPSSHSETSQLTEPIPKIVA
jgi:hypothetical protein